MLREWGSANAVSNRCLVTQEEEPQEVPVTPAANVWRSLVILAQDVSTGLKP